jgi:hypothetical protein
MTILAVLCNVQPSLTELLQSIADTATQGLLDVVEDVCAVSAKALHFALKGLAHTDTTAAKVSVNTSSTAQHISVILTMSTCAVCAHYCCAGSDTGGYRGEHTLPYIHMQLLRSPI